MLDVQNGQQQPPPSSTTDSASMMFRKPALGLRLRLSFDDFQIIEQVGEGTYGRVYKARNKHTNKLSALKVVFPTEDDEGLPFTAVREIKYLQTLSDNPNIIKLEGTFFTTEGELVLAFEYMENDLSGLLSLKNLQFTPAQTKCLFKQVLEGLHQCHTTGIMHRDIKAANLLLNQGQLKLADFGLASNYLRRRTFSTNVVTLWYRAPELLLGVNSYGPKVDIWSAGCLFIELLTRQSPFPGRDEKHQLELIVRTCGTPDETNWPGVSKLEGFKMLQGLSGHKNRLSEVFSKFEPSALSLLSSMLALDPAKRPTASEALDHDYFWSDPLPCKATELPHYPAMHEYEAKKTRQNERHPAKRHKPASYVPSSDQVPPLRGQPYPPHLYGPSHSQPPFPPHSSRRGYYQQEPYYGSGLSKPGHYGHASVPRSSGPPTGSQWGSAAHGTHPQYPGRRPPSSGDGILPTPVHPHRSHSSGVQYDTQRMGRHPSSGGTLGSGSRHLTRPSGLPSGAPRNGQNPPGDGHSTHPHSSNGLHDARHDALLSPGAGRHGGHHSARNSDYRHAPHRERRSSSGHISADVGADRHEISMAAYNRPPAGAHRPHHHTSHTIADARGSYHVHMSHARATLSSVECVEVAVKRKRESTPL